MIDFSVMGMLEMLGAGRVCAAFSHLLFAPVCLLSPACRLLIDGFKSLMAGNPNMNSLVAIGSSTSFTVGAASALHPGLGFDASFLEEPVMLLAFVLLGRALEALAKVRAAAETERRDDHVGAAFGVSPQCLCLCC